MERTPKHKGELYRAPSEEVSGFENPHSYRDRCLGAALGHPVSEGFLSVFTFISLFSVTKTYIFFSSYYSLSTAFCLLQELVSSYILSHYEFPNDTNSSKTTLLIEKQETKCMSVSQVNK